MQDFPGNSQRAKGRSEGPPKDERPKVEQVTSAEARPRKRHLGLQIKETFIGGSARMAVDYMVTDVVVPAIQATLIDALQGGIERLIRGDSRHSRRSGIPGGGLGYTNVGHVDYQRKSQSGRPPGGRMLSRESRARGSFEELVIPTRAQADEVIDRMYEILSRYEVVTLADLYEMTGIQGSHTDNKWGWTQLRGVRVRPLRAGGYLLDLPEPEAL